MKYSLLLVLLLLIVTLEARRSLEPIKVTKQDDDDKKDDKDSKFDDKDSSSDVTKILDDFNKARGFMQGLEQGLYNYRTFELDKKCFSYDSAVEVEDLYVEIT